jgi:glucokinase
MDNQKNHWVGFDLGGTKMYAVVFNEKLEMVGKCRKKTKGREGQQAGLARIVATINEALADARVTADDLAGIGIGCPGPLDIRKGIIHEAPNLGWKEVPVKNTLEKAFKCPVIVANDVDSGVFGEYKFGAAKNAHCVVGIFPGTGIGGGCVYRGQLVQGANCTAMEIGHIPLIPDGPLDGAGNKGTLEGVASRLAIASAAAAAAFRGQAPHLLEIAGTDIANIRSGTLARSIQGGDEAVAEIVLAAAGYLSQAIVTMILLMAPDVVVLGGGLVEAMPDLFMGEVRKRTQKRILPAFRDVYRIVVAELGDEAGAMGAAAWARESIEAKS